MNPRRAERSAARAAVIPFFFLCTALLLAACGPDWRAAARVVGTAMGNCDAHNLMGDVFFTARLNSLIDAGRIEASGPPTTLRDYSVRLADR